MGIFDFGFNFSRGGGTNPVMSKDLMKFQSKLWKDNTEWFNKNGYSFLREGLINADYNPILAIGASPLDGQMPSSTAMDGTSSAGMTWNGASASQAQTAKDMSKSQIMVNKATADKTTEEALTQSYVRNNLDSQSLLNLLQSEEIRRLLPYKEQKMLAEIAVADSVANLNTTTAQYVPYNAYSGRITANANDKNADTNATWTPAKIVAGAIAGVGLGGLGLLTKGKNLWKGYKTANQFKKYKKLNNSSSYYKDFAGTTIH